MKPSLIQSIFLSVALAAGASAQTAPEQEYRDFKGSNGVVIKAVVIDKNDKEAVLLLRDGKRAAVPLEKLGEEDRAYVKTWSKDQAVFLQKCRGLTIRQCLELRGYESFPFRLVNNSLFIDGKIDGKPARLLIDTGASTSILHLQYANEVGLKVGPMDEKILGVSGEAPAGWTPVPSLQLGEAVFKDRRILASDLLKDRPEGTKSREDCILGADFMAKLDAVISYPEGRIFLRPDRSDQNETGVTDASGALDFRLFKTKEGKALRGRVASTTPTVATIQLVGGNKVQMPIDRFNPEDQAYLSSWSEEGAVFLQHCQGLTVNELLTLRKYQSFKFVRRHNHIFVDGTLNGNKVAYMIDTGADNSVLHIEAAKKYGCEVGPMDQEVWGIGGKAPAAVSKIAKLTLDEMALTNRKVLATDLTRGDDDSNMDHVGIFGADFMRELDAVISYTEDRIFLIQR